MSTTAGGAALLIALATSPAGAGSAPAAAVAAAPAGGCSATAHIDTQWGSGATGGEIVTVTVANTSATMTTKWSVTWTLGAGQQVVSAWNASVSVSGGAATAVNAGYNAVLAPGSSTTFGMQLSGVAAAPVLSCDNGATPPTSSPPGSPDVTVGLNDNWHTVTLFVGESLGVSLSEEFRAPTVTGSALTQLSASGGYPSRQPVSALYRAVSVGSADIATASDYDCLHWPTPCTVAAMPWKVHVNVIEASGQTVTVSTADNRGTARLRVGDTLVVRLAMDFQVPTLSVAGVLAPRDIAGGYPTNQPLVARYTAVTAGTVDVSTLTDGPCNHWPTPCPSPQNPWSIHVIVTA